MTFPLFIDLSPVYQLFKWLLHSIYPAPSIQPYHPFHLPPVLFQLCIFTHEHTYLAVRSSFCFLKKNLPIDQPHFHYGCYFHLVLTFTVQPPLPKHTSRIYPLWETQSLPGSPYSLQITPSNLCLLYAGVSGFLTHTFSALITAALWFHISLPSVQRDHTRVGRLHFFQKLWRLGSLGKSDS